MRRVHVLIALASMLLAVVPADAGAGPSADCRRPLGSSGRDKTPDGRYVVFSSSSPLVAGDTNGACDIFFLDRKTGRTELVSIASDGSHAQTGLALFPEPNAAPDSIDPRISNSGRYVTFLSAASDLVPDDTNLAWDRFVHDRKTGITRIR